MDLVFVSLLFLSVLVSFLLGYTVALAVANREERRREQRILDVIDGRRCHAIPLDPMRKT